MYRRQEGGLYAVPIKCAPPSIPGSYTYPIKVVDVKTGYSKTAIIRVEVRGIEAVAIPFPHVLIEDINPRMVDGTPGVVHLSFKVRGYNDYHGSLTFSFYDPNEPSIIVPPINFSPSSVTLTPGSPEASTSLTFKIKRGTPLEQYTIWIKAMEGML